MKYDIFVSYRRADRELVAMAVRSLESRGLEVWYDAEIEGGADWREAIVEALTASQMLVIFFSEDCNNSRQLKKELAVADQLGKPVVPILIENTQPRGAYLYELADRNWLQAFPDPKARLNDIVDHLAALAGKADAGPAGARPVDVLQQKSAPAANAPARDGLEDAIEEALADATEDGSAAARAATRSASKTAPKMAKDYVGRASASGKPPRKLADIPPFRWIDLAVLIPAWLAIAAWRIYATMGQSTAATLDRDVAFIALICLAFTGLYGAIVFPVRYFLRGRPVIPALLRYLGTSVMFFLAGAGVVLTGMDRGYMEGADMLDFLRLFAIAWGGLSVLAFMIYGALAGQRALGRFRSNLRKI